MSEEKKPLKHNRTALLECHKARNFSYQGFDLTIQALITLGVYSFDQLCYTNLFMTAYSAI